MRKETKIKQKLTCELIMIEITVNMTVAVLNVVEMRDIAMMTTDMIVT